MSRPFNVTEFFVYGIIPHDRVNGSYSLIMKDNEDLGRMVSLIIGSPEAQSIAIFLDGPELERPLTHDLFCNLLMDRSLDVEHVSIDGSMEETFFATMMFSDGQTIDCRPSDAISIAIRLGSPIFIQNDIVEQLSFEHGTPKSPKEEQPIKPAKRGKSQTKKKQKDESLESLSDLENRLQEAIDKEDYETAAKLRDMINKK